MEENLKRALDFANYRNTLSNQMSILKEKIDAKLTYGYNGGIFKIDIALISFVNSIIGQGRTQGVPMLDTNGIPVIVDDMEKFRDEITDRYFSSVLEYHEKYQEIKKSRTVEKMVDL
jgi:hypothetical protein